MRVLKHSIPEQLPDGPYRIFASQLREAIWHTAKRDKWQAANSACFFVLFPLQRLPTASLRYFRSNEFGSLGSADWRNESFKHVPFGIAQAPRKGAHGNAHCPCVCDVLLSLVLPSRLAGEAGH